LLPVELWNEYRLPSTVNSTVGYQLPPWLSELTPSVNATTVPSVRAAEARKLAVEAASAMPTQSSTSPIRPKALPRLVENRPLLTEAVCQGPGRVVM
jgi:hypothetical protein